MSTSRTSVLKRAKKKSVREVKLIIANLENDENVSRKRIAWWEEALQVKIGKASKKKTSSLSSSKKKLTGVQQRSKKKGLSCNLTAEIITDLRNSERCHYTGAKLCSKTGHSNTVTLDRVDNRKGYTVDNVVAASHCANNVKNMLFEAGGAPVITEQELVNFASSMYHMKMKPNMLQRIRIAANVLLGKRHIV